MKKQRGFTLVEVVVSMGVGMVIIAAIYAAVLSSQRSTVAIERKMVSQQDARSVLEIMAIEIQMASYNPNYAIGMWKSPTDCTTAATSQNYRGIQSASATSLSVEADINENSAIAGSGNPNEIITYAFNAASQYITRETNCGGAQPFLGDSPTSGRPRQVRVINTDAQPVFRYYNAQGTEITGTQLPGSIPQIARIDIALSVETEDIDPATNQRRQMLYSTSVIPRNHVITAGN